jgi:hypothetical protein
MNTNRRNFLIKTAAAVPGVAFADAAQGMAGASNFNGRNQLRDSQSKGESWFNVRDCGVSGSIFETTAATSSGSKQIIVADVGDFKVGQGVMVSKCNIRYERTQMWSTGIPYVNHDRRVGNSFDVRGYDGSAGSWVVYVLDIEPSSSPVFRWTDDLSRTWHTNIPITHDWQPLSGGIEVRFNQRDWESGYVIAFGVRDQLISRIEKIEGNVLTLQDEANRTVNDAVLRHNDTLALQTAVDLAIREKLNVYVPVGHYMLAKTIRVRNAQAITIEGASAVDTVFDISEGEGACFTLDEGTEVTIRNFRMLGFMGFDERDKAGELNTRGSRYIWGFGLKHCNGITISNTQRVLVENCHASRMSGECFVAGGRSRGTVQPGQSYTQGITYLRCSVTDSARNAFNDVCSSIENTSILNCRITDVGGNAWEGASRFVKFTGNYIRNAGGVEMGNLGPANREAGKLNPQNRDKMYPELGAGQHIIADNVFESNIPYGPGAICSRVGATQVIIRNNIFINFGSSGVQISGDTDPTHYPSSNTIITGNIFDMTCVGQKSELRTAITVGANDAIVSDNQIYVRGSVDTMVTAILLHEPALNLNVHNNLVRNCGVGIFTKRGVGRIGEVLDNRTFMRSKSSFGLPLERVQPEMCKGWILLWRTDAESKSHTGMSIIDSFYPETLRFRLRKPCTMKTEDLFEVVAPSLNWNIHNNTITDCLRPVVLNSYGSSTSLLKDNLVNRGNTTNVLQGVEVHGRFQILDNYLNGFDEQGATALSLFPDASGRPCISRYQGNTFGNCFKVVTESQPGLWKNSKTNDNLAIDCVHKIL